MRLWQLVRVRSRAGRITFLIASVASGLLTARFAYGLAGIASDPTLDDPFARGFGALLAISLIQYGRAWIGSRVSGWFALAARDIRRHLMVAYLRLEPASLPKVDTIELREALGTLPRRLANLMESHGLFFTTVFATSGNLVGIFLLDVPAGFALLTLVVSYGLFLLAQVTRMRDSETLARRQDVVVANGFSDLMRGFKETRLDPAKLEAIQRTAIRDAMDARVIARSAYRLRLGLTGVLARSIDLIGALICVAAVRLTGGDQATAQLTMVVALLFYFNWLSVIPQLASAASTSSQLEQLEDRLASAQQPGPPERDTDLVESHPFESLELRDVTYRHPPRPGAPGFVIGPLSCSIRPGQITFITGGNGSGKSTLTRLLCGLNAPDNGQVLYNGMQVDGRACRERVAFVPALPILFEQLHGVTVDADVINAQLADFGLGNVVRFEDGRFSRLGLSTGQRKRVALIGALQQQRPILVLDEWAADQDPPMRQRFYREILPSLRAQGIAVIAVTHDDRYFDAADQVLRMEYGQLMS